MSAGILADSNEPAIFVLLLDYYGLRMNEATFFPGAHGDGFCFNEVHHCIEGHKEILVIGVADAIPPLSIADTPMEAFDIRGLLDDGHLHLGDKREDFAFEELQEVQAASVKPFDSMPMSKLAALSSLSKDHVKQGMATYFSHRWGASVAVNAVVELVEGGDYSNEAIRAKAAQVGARATPVREFKHWGRGFEDLPTGGAKLRPPVQPDGEVLPREPETEPETTDSGVRRIVISGEPNTAPLIAAIATQLRSEGHLVEFDASRLFGGDGGYIESAIDWAAARKKREKMPAKPTPLGGSVEKAAAAVASGGCFLLLMTHGSVGKDPPGFCKNQIVYAMNTGLPIIPLRLSGVTVPLEICRIQYVDLGPVHFNHRVPFVENGGFRDTMAQLKRAVSNGPEGTGAAHALRRKLEDALKPFDQSGEIGSHTSEFIGRQWLCREIHEWLDDVEAPPVRVYESPTGSGKTALAAFLTRSAQSIAAQHLATEDAATCNLRRVITHIVFQIVARADEGPACLLGAPGSSKKFHLDQRPAGEPTQPLDQLTGMASAVVLARELLVNALGGLLDPSGAAPDASDDADPPAYAAAAAPGGAAAAAAASAAAAAGKPSDDGLEDPSAETDDGFGYDPSSEPAAGQSGLSSYVLSSSTGQAMLVIDGLERMFDGVPTRADGDAAAPDEQRANISGVIRALTQIGSLLAERAPWVRILLLANSGTCDSMPSVTTGTRAGPVVYGGTAPRLISQTVEVVDVIDAHTACRRRRCADQDMLNFVDARLRAMPECAGVARMTEAQRKVVRDAIVLKAEENFDYADSTLKMAAETGVVLSEPDFEKALHSPKQLHANKWQLQKSKIDAVADLELRAKCHQCLDVVACCSEPVNPHILLEQVLGLNKRRERETIIEALAPCFSPRGQDQILRPYHNTFLDWFRGLHVDKPRGHGLLLRWGARIARAAEEECDRSESEREAVSERLKLASGGTYVLHNLLDHVEAVGHSPTDSGVAADRLWLLQRCKPSDPSDPTRPRQVDFALKVARLRRLGMEKLNHGELDRQAAIARVHGATGARKGEFLIRTSSRAGPGAVVVTHLDGAGIMVQAKVFLLDDGRYSLRPAAESCKLDEYRDLEALIAHQQVIGTLTTPVLAPSASL